MKQVINIKSNKNKYSIVIEKNSVLRNISKELNSNNKTIIIIDSKLSELYAKLKKKKNIYLIKVTGGEEIKSLKNFEKICLKILKNKINRTSTLIAIGGGSVGDVSGFIANTILRGLKFILIPSTLLSQVDSSIGGKNGVNTIYGKNLIGTFYPPNKVIIDISLLKTLPKREIRSGYAEIFKHALINNIKFYNWLNKNCIKILNLNPKYISEAIIESIKIKAFFVQMDENETLRNSNSRAMLNFGHTFGHALETMDNYSNSLNHGEAISIGMSIAAMISKNIGSLSHKEYEGIIMHLKGVNLPTHDKRLNNNKIYQLMLSDKKNISNKIHLILLEKIGKAYFHKGMSREEIKRSLK